MLITSHSQLTNAVSCPWLYYVTTRLRDRIVLKAQAQVVGTLVHTVAERFLTEVPDRDTMKRPYQLGTLHGLKDEEFTKQFGEKALEAINLYFDEYNEACDATIEFGRSIGREYKAPTWTGYWQRTYAARFDELERTTFQPLQAELRNIRFQSTLLDVYQHISRCTDNFLKVYRKLGKPKKMLVEYRLDPRINIHGAMKGGRIDLITWAEDYSIAVWDFKTGRKQWSPNDIVNEPQLLWYAYGVEQQFGQLPAERGILDLYNGDILKAPVLPCEIEHFKKTIQGAMAHEQRLHDTIEQEGIEKALEQFPLPIGRLNLGCPCNLAYEEDSEIKCPAYRTGE